MTENPHENEDLRPPCEKLSEKKSDEEKNGAWSEDQKKRGYYYDDAHGYEIYKDECDNEEEDN